MWWAGGKGEGERACKRVCSARIQFAIAASISHFFAFAITQWATVSGRIGYAIGLMQLQWQQQQQQRQLQQELQQYEQQVAGEHVAGRRAAGPAKPAPIYCCCCLCFMKSCGKCAISASATAATTTTRSMPHAACHQLSERRVAQ